MTTTNAMTATVGARELKVRLGSYLRLVKSGTALVVTERGRPVAEIRPLPRAKDDEEGVLRDLAARGLVRLGRGGPLPPVRKTRVRGKPLSEAILEDREDRF